jgi:hypothetical protein
MVYMNVEECPDASFFAGLDDEELDAVLQEAISAELAAEEWSMAAMDEFVQRSQRPPPLPLHERLRAAEERRLRRRRKKPRRSKPRR